MKKMLVKTTQCSTFIQSIVDRILALPSNGFLRVAIDGVDGAGKTTFADELAHLRGLNGRPIIRASVDSFHNPRSIRYRQGKNSSDGFYHDSYNYSGLMDVLLSPLAPSGSNKYRTATFEHTTDSEVIDSELKAPLGSILVFDGILLHHPELRGCWDFSIFLKVALSV